MIIRHYLLIILMFFIVIQPSPYATAACWDGPAKIVARINDSPVYEDEFEFVKQGLRSDCLTYFANKYGTYNEADFWQHSFKGEVPAIWIKEKTLALCKQQKLLIAVMNKYGVLKNFTYSSFKNKWQQENTARSNQIKNGGLVYGTVNFDEQTYHTYVMSNALLATKHAIVKQCNFTEKQWATCYEQIKFKHFKKLPTKQLMLYKCGQNNIVDSVTLNFNPSSNKTDELTWGEVYTRSLSLTKPGQITEHFRDANGDECFIKCITITDNGFFSFQEMINNVKALYAEQVINNEVKRSSKSCVVKVYN